MLFRERTAEFNFLLDHAHQNGGKQSLWYPKVQNPSIYCIAISCNISRTDYNMNTFDGNFIKHRKRSKRKLYYLESVCYLFNIFSLFLCIFRFKKIGNHHLNFVFYYCLKLCYGCFLMLLNMLPSILMARK